MKTSIPQKGRAAGKPVHVAETHGYSSVQAYPVAPESMEVAAFPAVQCYAAPEADGEVVQLLKSRFTQLEVDSTAKSPIAELSAQLSPYFSASGIAEQYVFHGDVIKKPNDYKEDYKKANKVTAVIESDSRGKNGERDNSIITPYGHFGLMERSILGRTSYGNLFDGGHLIERSLMEGADADCHGNLAPQEGKLFNQDLMRGWEHIPEVYQSMMSFIYSMELTYNGSTYQRTGKQLIEAGVVPIALLDWLKTQGAADAFLQKSFTFSRWIPYAWKGDINTGSATTFPSHAFNMGAHYQRLKPTPEEAYSRVINDPATNAAPALVRTKSGMISGAISGLAVLGDQQFTVGNSSKISSIMYSGVPEPSDVQAKGDREEKEVKSVFPASGGVDVLAAPFYLSRMLTHLLQVQTKQKINPRLNLKSAGIAQKARENPEFSLLYKQLRDADRTANFVRAIQAQFQGVASPKLTKSLFLELAGAYFDEQTKLYATLITYDPKCLEDEPVAVFATASAITSLPLVSGTGSDVTVTASAMDVEDEELD
jgi:hypothetical protein